MVCGRVSASKLWAPANGTREDRQIIVALALALAEIRSPGTNRKADIDIIAVCERLLAAAYAEMPSPKSAKRRDDRETLSMQ